MLLSTLLTLLLPTLALTAPTALLGGIDMNRACREQYGSDYLAFVDEYGCSGWKCRSNSDKNKGIDTPRACVSQYGGGATALCGK